MISKIIGKISGFDHDRVFIEVGGLTYNIMVPSSLQERLRHQNNQIDAEIHTLYYIEGSNVGNQFPRLVGFADPVQREFFTALTSVSGLGIKKALRSLVVPINIIAQAIETEDSRKLTELPGIGPRMAEKIIAELKGKVAKFALIRDAEPLTGPVKLPDFSAEVMQVLRQLQYHQPEAKAMSDRALATGKKFKSSEEMLELIFKQQKLSQ